MPPFAQYPLIVVNVGTHPISVILPITIEALCSISFIQKWYLTDHDRSSPVAVEMKKYLTSLSIKYFDATLLAELLRIVDYSNLREMNIVIEGYPCTYEDCLVAILYASGIPYEMFRVECNVIGDCKFCKKQSMATIYRCVIHRKSFRKDNPMICHNCKNEIIAKISHITSPPLVIVDKPGNCPVIRLFLPSYDPITALTLSPAGAPMLISCGENNKLPMGQWYSICFGTLNLLLREHNLTGAMNSFLLLCEKDGQRDVIKVE